MLKAEDLDDFSFLAGRPATVPRQFQDAQPLRLKKKLFVQRVFFYMLQLARKFQSLPLGVRLIKQRHHKIEIFLLLLYSLHVVITNNLFGSFLLLLRLLFN